MQVCEHVSLFLNEKVQVFYNVFVREARSPRPDTGHIYVELELNTDCFKIIKCDMPFMRSHEARPGTDPSKSELWEESTLLCPHQNFGENSPSLSPLIYANDCKSCITSCQLAGCLILDFPYQRRLF